MVFQKICVIHLNQIGDLVFSLPLLKALKDNNPDCCIHSVVKPHLQELLDGVSSVDKILLRGKGLKSKRVLLKQIRENGYDLLISLPRSEESLLLTSLSKAAVKAGFAHFPWDFFLDVKEEIEGHNSCYNNFKLLKRLDIPITKKDYVGLVEADRKGLDFYLPEKYAVFSPGASMRRLSKTWMEDKFAALIRLLKDKYDLSPVLVGGNDCQDYNRTIVDIIRENEAGNAFDVVNLTGKIGLRTLCSVMQRARLFVGIDSGVMHLASSLDIPVVALFGPTDPFYVGPQNAGSIVVREESMECVPCYLKACDHRDCMRRLDVDRVMEACDHVLSH